MLSETELPYCNPPIKPSQFAVLSLHLNFQAAFAKQGKQDFMAAQEMQMVSRSPFKISPSTAGSMILNSISLRVAESERPVPAIAG